MASKNITYPHSFDSSIPVKNLFTISKSSSNLGPPFSSILKRHYIALVTTIGLPSLSAEVTASINFSSLINPG